MPKLKNKMKGVINVLTAVYTPRLVAEYMNQYGNAPLYHSIFEDCNHYANGWGSKHYGFRRGNLYLERQQAKDTKAKAIHNINSYIKLKNAIFKCHYNILQLKHSHNNPITPTNQLYTLLITSADGTIKKINNQPFIFDKRNGKEVYKQYQLLIRKLSQYVNRHNTTRTLLLKPENPFHYNNRIYTHPHLHGIISTTNAHEASKIEDKARDLFNKIFGYKPILCHIQPLYNSLNKTIKYLLKDRKIQTKDTDNEFFKGIHSKLRMNQLRLAFNAQINSSTGHRVAYIVANTTIRAMKKELNQLRAEINKLNKKNKLITKKQPTYKIKSMKINSKENTNTFHSNYSNLIIINYIKINQNKKANQLSAFQLNKYPYIYTTSGIPP